MLQESHCDGRSSKKSSGPPVTATELQRFKRFLLFVIVLSLINLSGMLIFGRQYSYFVAGSLLLFTFIILVYAMWFLWSILPPEARRWMRNEE